jgi:outer membrane protein assembly factor BamB
MIRRQMVALLFLVGALTGRYTWAEEWSRFRGPNGTGVSPTEVPVRWTEENCLWKTRLAGVGHSSPVVWNAHLFLTSGDEKTGQRVVECIRAEDGKVVWTYTLAGETHRKHRDNSYASATPAVDDRHVYVCWGSPDEYLVQALTHQGKEVWRIDLGPYRSGHGFGASPIVAGNVVIVPNDQGGTSSIVALDRMTGKQVWKVPRKSKAAYITPCLLEGKGSTSPEVILTSWEHGITAIDVKTGKVTWEADAFAKGHVETPIGSPIVSGGVILATCGWLGVRQEVLAIQPPRSEQAKPRVVYTLDRHAPLCTTPLVHGELLFLWSDRGIVTCADVETGEIHWQQRVRGSFYSSPIAAGKYLYNVSRQGDVIVLEAGREFKQVASNPVGEGSHSTPALAHGRMYVRTFTHLLAIGTRK